MNISRIKVVYFSPTGGTESIARFIAAEISRLLGIEPQFIDITKPESRLQDYRFEVDTLVLTAIPVYAGRIPNKLLPDLSARLAGNGAPAIPICVFGNRSPDEALRELALLMEDNGFRITGAASFACRHAFTDKVGTGRPDQADEQQMRDFANRMAEKLNHPGPLSLLELSHSEIGPYYAPLKKDGTPAKFLKAKPLTDWSRCIHCGRCTEGCPMGSITETAEAAGVCIKCQACVRHCPVHAKYFEDTDFLSHVAMLEQNYTRRAENVMLV